MCLNKIKILWHELRNITLRKKEMGIKKAWSTKGNDHFTCLELAYTGTDYFKSEGALSSQRLVIENFCSCRQMYREWKTNKQM